MDEKLVSLLESLAGKLNTTTERLYLVLVKQAKVDAWIAVVILVFMSFGLIALYFGWVYLVPLCVDVPVKSQFETPHWPFHIQLIACGLGMGTCVLVTFFIVQLEQSIDTVITAIFNPEAAALNTILDKID